MKHIKKCAALVLCVQTLLASEDNSGRSTPPLQNSAAVEMTKLSLAEIRQQMRARGQNPLLSQQEAHLRDLIKSVFSEEDLGRANILQQRQAEFLSLESQWQLSRAEVLTKEEQSQEAILRFLAAPISSWKNTDIEDVYSHYNQYYMKSKNSFLSWIQEHPLLMGQIIELLSDYHANPMIKNDLTFYQFALLNKAFQRDKTVLTEWEINLTLLDIFLTQLNIEKESEFDMLMSYLSFNKSKSDFFNDHYKLALETQWKNEVGKVVQLISLGVIKTLQIIEENPHLMEAFLNQKSISLARSLLTQDSELDAMYIHRL